MASDRAFGTPHKAAADRCGGLIGSDPILHGDLVPRSVARRIQMDPVMQGPTLAVGPTHTFRIG